MIFTRQLISVLIMSHFEINSTINVCIKRMRIVLLMALSRWPRSYARSSLKFVYLYIQGTMFLLVHPSSRSSDCTLRPKNNCDSNCKDSCQSLLLRIWVGEKFF